MFTRCRFPTVISTVVTLQFASRHLRIRQVFAEIFRVLTPGGRFYHSDMLRPTNPVVEKLYYRYLRFCLWFTALLFRSGPAARNCKEYFINALQMFYSAEELSHVLEDIGFSDVTSKTIFAGMLGFHRSVRPYTDTRRIAHSKSRDHRTLQRVVIPVQRPLHVRHRVLLRTFFPLHGQGQRAH
jgi:SAM-dependent methyltransferase